MSISLVMRNWKGLHAKRGITELMRIRGLLSSVMRSPSAALIPPPLTWTARLTLSWNAWHKHFSVLTVSDRTLISLLQETKEQAPPFFRYDAVSEDRINISHSLSLLRASTQERNNNICTKREGRSSVDTDARRQGKSAIECNTKMQKQRRFE